MNTERVEADGKSPEEWAKEILDVEAEAMYWAEHDEYARVSAYEDLNFDAQRQYIEKAIASAIRAALAAADSASGEKVICQNTTTAPELIETQGEGFYLQPGEELVARKVRGT